MKPNYSFPLKKHKIPENFVSNLQDFIKEVLKTQPNDIIEFGYAYFDAKCSGSDLDYNNARSNTQRSVSGKSLHSQTTHKTEKRASMNYIGELYGNVFGGQDESGSQSRALSSRGDQNISGEERQSNSSNLQKIVGELEINIISASNLPIDEEDQELDCYAIIFISNDPMKIVKTDNVEGNNPEWDYFETLFLYSDSAELKELELVIQVYDCAYTKSLIGEVSIPLEKIVRNGLKWADLDVDLIHPDVEDHSMGNVRLRLRFGEEVQEEMQPDSEMEME